MRRRLALLTAAVAVLAAALATLAWRAGGAAAPRRAPAPGAPASTAPEREAGDALGIDVLGDGARTSEPREAPAVRRSIDVAAPAPVTVLDTSAPDPRFVVTGRVLSPRGAGAPVPAPGARVSFVATRKQTDEDASARAFTDAQGRFELALARGGPQSGCLLVHSAGCVGIVHPVERGISPRVDVGDLELLLGGTIEGLVEGAGSDAGAKWRVRVAVDAPVRGAHGARTVHEAPIDSLGRFRVEGVAPGRAHVTIPHARGGIVIERDVVDVWPGETARVTLHARRREPRAERPVAADAIVVRTRLAPEHRLARPPKLRRESVRLVGTTEPLQPRRRPGGALVFAPVPPGVYALELDDPRFLPARRTDVRPGTTVEIELAGSATLALEIVDAATRAPVPRCEAALLGGRARQILASARDDPAVFRAPRRVIPVANASVHVEARGYVAARAALGELVAGEERRVVIEMSASRAVHGRVLWAPEAPLAGARVSLRRAEPSDGRPPAGGAQPVARAETDARGRFSLHGAVDGEWMLEVEEEPCELPPVPIRIAGADVRGIDVVLDGHGQVAGRVCAPGTPDFRAFTIAITTEGKRRGRGKRRGPPPVHATCALAADGSFAQLLPPGRYRLTVDVWPSLGGGRAVLHAALGDGAWVANATQRRLPLARIALDVAAGASTAVEIDAGALGLGACAVHASSHGRPCVGWRAALVREDASAVVLGVLDGNGNADATPIEAGEWRLVVYDERSTWIHPEPVRVEAGEQAFVAVDARGAPGRLLVLDEVDRAWAEQTIAWESEAYGAAIPGAARTDAVGALELTLAPGRYRFHLDAPRRGRAADARGAETWVEWTAAGPSPSVLRFPREASERVRRPALERAREQAADRARRGARRR